MSNREYNADGDYSDREMDTNNNDTNNDTNNPYAETTGYGYDSGNYSGYGGGGGYNDSLAGHTSDGAALREAGSPIMTNTNNAAPATTIANILGNYRLGATTTAAPGAGSPVVNRNQQEQRGSAGGRGDFRYTNADLHAPEDSEGSVGEADEHNIQTVRVITPPSGPPPRRPRTVLLGLLLILMFALTVPSLLVNVFTYKDPNSSEVHISVDWWSITVCPEDQVTGKGCTSDDDLSSYTCDAFANPLASAGNIGIFNVVLQLFIFCALVLEYFGFMLHRKFTFRLMWVVWVCLMIQWTIGANVFLNAKCKGISFKSMGFKYAAGWSLVLSAWCILPIPLLLIAAFSRRLQGKAVV